MKKEAVLHVPLSQLHMMKEQLSCGFGRQKGI